MDIHVIVWVKKQDSFNITRTF